ncbi:MAG: hypothetical protein RMY29_023200 [Nostoc sp. CreGUA01]|nr:hypothetical protein [Nostoc sp. CreGUA01]
MCDFKILVETLHCNVSTCQWKIPSYDGIFSIGKLQYRNDLLPNDFSSEGALGANISLTVSDPMTAIYSSNIYFDFINRRDGAETITMGYRGGDPKKHQFKNNSPIFFDFLGARKVGTNSSTPLKYSVDVPDGTSIELELFGRMYTTCQRVVGGGKKTITLQDLTSSSVPGGAGKDTGSAKAYMVAEFNPNYNLTIPAAAELCGYDHFNWYQRLTSDTEKRSFITDPGKTAFGSNEPRDSYPYYYDENSNSDSYYGKSNYNYAGNFNFRDRPTVKPIGILKPGKVAFQTHLVGVSKDNSCFSESLYQFEWSSIYTSFYFFDYRLSKFINHNGGRYNNRPVSHDLFYGSDIVFSNGRCGFISQQNKSIANLLDMD